MLSSFLSDGNARRHQQLWLLQVQQRSSYLQSFGYAYEKKWEKWGAFICVSNTLRPPVRGQSLTTRIVCRLLRLERRSHIRGEVFILVFCLIQCTELTLASREDTLVFALSFKS